MRMNRLSRAIVHATMAIMVTAGAAKAQTPRFEWANTAVDLSTYTSIYQCMAAVGRVQNERAVVEHHADPVDRDTLPYDPDVELYRPSSPEVGETARACLAATAEDAANAPVDAWQGLAQLYLHAGMEDSARAVVERRIEAVDPDGAEELKDIFIQALFMYGGSGSLSIRPPLIELADDIILDHVGRLSDLRDQFQIFTQMLVTGGSSPLAEDAAGARTRRNLARIHTLLESASRDDFQQFADAAEVIGMGPDEVRERLEGMAEFFVGHEIFLDSLRVSTAAYSRILRETHGRAFGQPPELYMFGRPIGELAPTLEGDIWLGCESEPCDSYPRSGRISLVWFVDRRSDRCLWPNHAPSAFDVGTNCVGAATRLRRIQERFPELDLVVVANSAGRYGWVTDDVTLEVEAELLRSWLDGFGLDRATLSMTETPGWRLPRPDGRRVDQPTANARNYSFQGTWTEDPQFILIDEDGYIVTVSRFDRYSEQEVTDIVEILFDRKGGDR